MTSHATTSEEIAGRVAKPPTRRPSESAVTAVTKPMLLFFYSQTSGGSRRAEGFLAQVLQRRRNHNTFAIRRIDHDSRPDIAARFGIQRAPAFVVVEHKRVRAKIEQPRGCVEIQSLLGPWLN